MNCLMRLKRLSSGLCRRGFAERQHSAKETEEVLKEYVSDIVSGTRNRPTIFRTKMKEEVNPIQAQTRIPKNSKGLSIRQAVTRLLSDPLVIKLIEEIDEEDANRSIELDFLDLKNEVTKSYDIVDIPESRTIKLLLKPATLSSLPAGMKSVEVSFDFESIVENYIQHVQNFRKMENTSKDNYLKPTNKNRLENFQPINGVREYGVSFIVSCKNEKAETMSIHCIGGNYGLVIRQIINASTKEITRCNRGEKLNFQIQKELLNFLSALNIDHNFAQFILAYSIEKEKNEYYVWLENMLSFHVV